MKVVSAGTKLAGKTRHYAGVLFDIGNFAVYSFYYTLKSPKFIRLESEAFGNFKSPAIFVLELECKIRNRGYRSIDLEQFSRQCPDFSSALGEHLVVRKLKDGI